MQAESPSSGRFTALGVYLLTSLIFIVVGFLEFAFMLLLQQQKEKQLQKQRRKLSKLMEWKDYWNGAAKSTEIGDIGIENDMCSIRRPSAIIRQIDVIGFFVFGALYILFNAIYWAIFLFIAID